METEHERQTDTGLQGPVSTGPNRDQWLAVISAVARDVYGARKGLGDGSASGVHPVHPDRENVAVVSILDHGRRSRWGSMRPYSSEVDAEARKIFERESSSIAERDRRDFGSFDMMPLGLQQWWKQRAERRLIANAETSARMHMQRRS